MTSSRKKYSLYLVIDQESQNRNAKVGQIINSLALM